MKQEEVSKTSNPEMIAPTSADDYGQIEIDSFNYKPFIGTKTKINSVELKSDGAFLPYFDCETEVITESNGKPITVRKFLGLQKNNETGQIGWGETSKTGAFLKEMGVSKPKELIGKEVILITRVALKGEHKGKTFLAF